MLFCIRYGLLTVDNIKNPLIFHFKPVSKVLTEKELLRINASTSRQGASTRDFLQRKANKGLAWSIILQSYIYNKVYRDDRHKTNNLHQNDILPIEFWCPIHWIRLNKRKTFQEKSAFSATNILNRPDLMLYLHL